MFSQQLGEDQEFLLLGLSTGKQAKGVGYEFLVFFLSECFHQLMGGRSGCFDELRAIEENKCLGGGVRSFASYHADSTLGRVERHHDRGGCGTFPKGVYASSVDVGRTVGVNRLEGKLEVVGLYPRATHFVVKQSADGEGGIANHLRGESIGRASGQKQICRIRLTGKLSEFAFLAVGGGEDHLVEQVTEIPA